MTTPTTIISSSDVNTELLTTSAATMTFNDADVRTLAEKTTNLSTISMLDMRGKARKWTGTKPSSILRPSSSVSICKSIAISGDGTTLAVAFAVPGGSGVGVYIYTKNKSDWVYQAVLKPSSAAPQSSEAYGYSIALSYNGDYCVVGDIYVDTMLQSGSGSAGSGQSFSYSYNVPVGAVFVFARSVTTWTMQQKIRPTDYIWNSYGTAYFLYGSSVSINNDGTLIAFGNPGDNNAGNPYACVPWQGAGSYGAIYIYTRSGTTWSKSQKILGTVFTAGGPPLGSAIAMTPDASTIVSAAGYIGLKCNAVADTPSQLLVYTRGNDGQYTLKQAITGEASDVTTSGIFMFTSSPTSFAISSDGKNFAVGYSNYSTGILGDPYYGYPNSYGRTKVYTYNGSTWSLQATLSTNTATVGEGVSVALSSDGNKLLVGAPTYGADVSAFSSGNYHNIVSGEGAAYLYTRTGSTWGAPIRIDPPKNSLNSTAALDNLFAYYGPYGSISFGFGVAMTPEASILAFAMETENGTGSGFTLM